MHGVSGECTGGSNGNEGSLPTLLTWGGSETLPNAMLAVSATTAAVLEHKLKSDTWCQGGQA